VAGDRNGCGGGSFDIATTVYSQHLSRARNERYRSDHRNSPSRTGLDAELHGDRDRYHAVALKVVKTLNLAASAATKVQFEKAGGKGSIEDWLAGQLLKKLDVKPSRESRIVEVIFTSVDPDFAATIANGFAQAYIQTNLAMKVAPAKESADWFDGQLVQLREQVEHAQARLSKYQTEKGITSTDQKLDVEAAKLAEISSQLVQIQAQAYENASRQRQLDEFISKHRNVDSLPEVLASPVIQDLKSRLSAAESRLSQASNTLGVNHPEYQRAQSEVTSLRKKLSDEINTAASVIGNNLRITQSRERELRDAVSAQKARLLDLNRHRDELGVLMKEVDNAQRAYEAASQRHSEASLGSRINQGDVVVLNPAGRAGVPQAAPDRGAFHSGRRHAGHGDGACRGTSRSPRARARGPDGIRRDACVGCSGRHFQTCQERGSNEQESDKARAHSEAAPGTETRIGMI